MGQGVPGNRYSHAREKLRYYSTLNTLFCRFRSLDLGRPCSDQKLGQIVISLGSERGGAVRVKCFSLEHKTC